VAVSQITSKAQAGAPSATGARSRSRLLYSAFAETILTFRRIDFAARLRWLLDLLKPHPIAGGANHLDHRCMWMFHCVQSLKQMTSLKFICNDTDAQRNETAFLT
jgi:hypothetical protein